MDTHLTDQWLVDNLPTNPIILDIGCNDGTHTINFGRLFPNGRVFGFEPEPRALNVFRSKEIPDNVQIFEYALSNNDGSDIFWRCSGFTPDDPNHREADWSGSLLKPKIHLDAVPWMKFDTTFEVETKRLDTWLKEVSIDHIDFIWMDVQGAEHLVFEGASEVLNKISYIHTEFDDRELYTGQKTLQELLGYLPNFKIEQNFGHDVLLRNDLITK
ncbi:FkbM family methyltransferase [Flavobacterium sp.]|jgi:FkbM family methyltransferase|uniref:FkbM family methyltransferase n=1 Tax=Flavobacterium sp. TaxID=239 RepID=UPI0037BF2334